MADKYTEYKGINWTDVAREVQQQWDAEKTFEQSVAGRPDAPPFIFFEGPPSANGMPGIHHVMARAIKDLFCRYKTQQGFRVERKAGWDTHGLPVELGVEKELGITKEDIGVKLTIEEYNDACRKAVMKYTDVWNNLTRDMGYWVNMEDPYITYEPKYMESVWYLLKRLFDKDLMYKGYTIQPYSPKAGTGLSSHELNMPGTYQNVKDTTVVAQFKWIPGDGVRVDALSGAAGASKAGSGTVSGDAGAVSGLAVSSAVSEASTSSKLSFPTDAPVYFLAWTTTPWTLPSNTALTVGPKLDYVLVDTFNPYTFERQYVILASARLQANFGSGFEQVDEASQMVYSGGKKEKIPYRVLHTVKGADLVGFRYEQLLPVAQPMTNPERAFVVIPGDFVTTEDGTGIVHTAPTFGADDARVAAAAGVPPMLVADESGHGVPLVDLQGRFRAGLGFLSGKYVKNEYYAAGEEPEQSVDVEIAIQLKQENKAFRVEKYEHSYPHCWRTDKPVLYYPLDSWFVRTTAVKERMIELNKTIQWKPEATGTGRFGNWLENLNDWNLSRSRFWGIPIPIWRTEDGSESLCIGSVAELKAACQASVEAGLMDANPLANFKEDDFSEANYSTVDLHKHVVDAMVLVSKNGLPMYREADLIDVWFDSGSMPYAQWHYPFENQDRIDAHTGFPADFIAEGVDQTRGWFFTLHAIATMAFDQVAYKTVVSNGLVRDKNGFKMSKSKGNAVDPFEILGKYGPDPTRWYLISTSQPWDDLNFNPEGIEEVTRKFFGTLHNTYSFFTLYANIDGFTYAEPEIPIAERPELDRWILSELHSTIAQVTETLDRYEPTKAARLISEFVTENLSNWFVRLSRRRFWKGSYGPDKISAYQTLYTALYEVARMMAPIAPFYADRLYRDLNAVTHRDSATSVHLSGFPVSQTPCIDADLEERMNLAQRVTSLVLSLRKKERVKVRQPLAKVMIPILNTTMKQQLERVADLIQAEVNVKSIDLLEDVSDILVKRIKPNFKALGPRVGPRMKQIGAALSAFTQTDIAQFEAEERMEIQLEDGSFELTLADVEIQSEDIPGWTVQSDGRVTVALDLTLSPELLQEGIARELVNRIQNARKDAGLEVTDRITLTFKREEAIERAVEANREYICTETLADSLQWSDNLEDSNSVKAEFDEIIATFSLHKV